MKALALALLVALPYLEPGETFTVACASLTASPTVGVALNWNEEF